MVPQFWYWRYKCTDDHLWCWRRKITKTAHPSLVFWRGKVTKTTPPSMDIWFQYQKVSTVIPTKDQPSDQARYTGIVKYYTIVPFERGHLFMKQSLEGVGEGVYYGQVCFKSPPLWWSSHCRRCGRESLLWSRLF